MKVAMVYVLPNLEHHKYVPMAQRFVRSYMDCPPGKFPHDFYVVVNGQEAGPSLKALFKPIPVNWLQHNNYAKDLGAYMLAATTVPSDLQICFGAHTNFRRGGWLDRMMDIYLRMGPGLYGCWGFHVPAPHIRTTSFWLPPDLLNTYPWLSNETRYSFEHSHDKSILKWTLDAGLPVIQVSWNRVGIYPEFYHCTPDDNLMFDQHCS